MNDDEFGDYCGTAAQACVTADDDLHMIFAINDPYSDEEILCLGVEENDGIGPHVSATLDQLMATRPFFVGLATKVHWSPTEDGESSPSWMLVCVVADKPAAFFVKRIIEDDLWWKVLPSDAPWFAISTAHSILDAIVGGEPLKLKTAKGKDDLFKRPSEMPFPQPDADGRL